MKQLYSNLIIGILLAIPAINLSSQTNTMYYMGTVPQSYYMNPATQPECNFFLGAPIVSSFQYTILNSGFSLTDDVLWYDSEVDSLVHPFSSKKAADKFLSNLKDVEFIREEVAFNLASFGFRAGKMYFSFDARVVSNGYTSYPKDLMELILRGNSNGEQFDFSSLNMEIMAYTEFGVNVSRIINDQLTIGVRPKILYGIGTANIHAEDVTLNTSTEEWVLNSKMSGNIAVTGMTIPVDDEGLIDLEGDFDFDSTITDNPMQNWQKAFGKNRGFGIDFGLHYRPVDDVELSLSLIDLGYIKWAENPQIISQNGSYTFQGYEWDLSDSNKWEDSILDTIESNFSLEGSPKAFKTYLSPKLMIGGRFFVTPGLSVGALSTTSFYTDKIRQDLALLANFHPIKWFSLSGSYNILGKTRTSFGLGAGLKFGPLNFYIMSDFLSMQRYDLVSKDLSRNIPIPADKYNFNLKLGFNLIFGCNKEKKLKQDKPLFNSTNWMF